MEARFRDRAHAGRLLAERLRGYSGRDDAIVLSLDLPADRVEAIDAKERRELDRRALPETYPSGV